jgi:hypothetical protein
VDRVSVPAHESRPRVDEFVRVPNLDAVGEEPRLDPFANQAAMHRIGVAVHVNQAAGVNATEHLQARRQACIGQVPQRLHLLGETIRAARVPRRHHLLQEADVFHAAGEIATAAEQERLIDGGLEVSVRRLGVAVLVRLPRVDALAGNAVVRQQVAIARLEFTRRRQVVHGGRQAVAPVPPRHAAQFPQRILQAIGQGLERLRRAQRHRLPVRVGQHEVIDHMIELLTGNRDFQRVHVSEVRRRQIAGLVDLAEHDGLPRSMGCPPLPDAAFKGAAMRIEELARVLATEPVEERLSEQPRLGLEPLLDQRPYRRERVEPRAVGARHRRLLPRARQRTLIAVMSGRLVAHACSPGRQGQANSRVEFAVQPSNLAIRNHRIPPRLRKLRLWQDDQKEGILIVAEEGKLIDATHPLVGEERR